MSETVADGPRGVEDTSTYPGPRQILRYLRIEQENRPDGTVWAQIPVLPDLLDAGGAVRLGAVSPMCDLVSGTIAREAVRPDWVATLDFKIHLTGAAREGHVQVLCRPLRVGRNTVLSESRMSDDAGRPLGLAIVTFTRLSRRDDQPQGATPPGRQRLARPAEEEPRIDFDQYLGLRFQPSENAIELDHSERLYNSFGSVQGGAMGSLLERAGSYAAEGALEAPARTVDLHFSYLAQARVGPFRMEAEVLRRDSAGVLSRITLVDRGQSDRLVAVATAQSVAIP